MVFWPKHVLHFCIPCLFARCKFFAWNIPGPPVFLANTTCICLRFSERVSLFLTFFANKCTIAVLLFAGGQFLFRGKLLAYLHDAYFALSSSFFAFQALEIAAFVVMLEF